MNVLISKIIATLVLALFGITVLAFVMSLPVYFLWNALLPSLFGFKTITWLQALGLMILSGCLFNGTSSSSS